MTENDIVTFHEAWVDAHEMSAGGKTPSDRIVSRSFDMLSDYPIEFVLQAITRHCKKQKFAPTVPDIIEMLEAKNKRLSADESWAELPFSERDSVVWTPEMAQAWSKASSLYYAGDKFGAQKAYKSAYERLCGESELMGKPITWSFNAGWDNEQKRQVLERAYRLGRISAETAKLHLPAPTNITIAGQALIGNESKIEKFSDEWKQKLADAKKIVADSLQAEVDKHNAEKLAAEQARRDKEDTAFQMLSPEEQALLQQANYERYREFDKSTVH